MGGNKNIGKEGVKTQFSSKNQPQGSAKGEGRKKAYLLKNIAGQLVTGKSKEAIQDLADYLGVEVERLDLETAMHLKQMEKALKKGDTSAYNAVMDRLRGKPKQDITSDGKPINPSNEIDYSKLSTEALKEIANLNKPT